MEIFNLSFSLFAYYSLIIIFGFFVNINGTLDDNKHEKFGIELRRGKIIYDETDGQILPNDYEFLLSPDAEDDVPDHIYEDVLPDLPPHDYIFRGKYLGQIQAHFITPKPIPTKFPHTKPPIVIPKNFKGQKERFLWLNSLHDTLFPDDTQKKINNKNNKKIEHNVPVKIKSGGQERDESKLLIQHVTTNLDITKHDEEKNNNNNTGVSLKSKNLIGAVNEIIKNNENNGVDTLTNDYNDNINFNDALRLAEADAKRVLEEYKKREEEKNIRRQEGRRVINNINRFIPSSTPKNLISTMMTSTNSELLKNNNINISTTQKPNIVTNDKNINDVLLSRLVDYTTTTTTTTMKPLTKKPIETNIISRNDNQSENNNISQINNNKISSNDITLSASFIVQKQKIETTTHLTTKKTTIKSQDIVVTSTKKSLLKNSTCPTLNAYRDGKPHPNTSQFCQTFIPGISNDNTCKCRYLVGSRDSNNCPSSFLYLCKPSVG